MKTAILVLIGFMAAFALASARSAAQEATFQSTDSPSSEPRNTFSSATDFENSPHTLQMRKDLASPASRQRLRDQYREDILRQHPEVGALVHLDAQEQEQLIELLTQQQMKHLDLFYQEAQGDPQAKFQSMTENNHRNDADLLTLLGNEKFELYRNYQQTVPERRIVVALASRLDTGNALTEEQKSALMKLLRSQQERLVLEQRRNLPGADGSAMFANTLPPPSNPGEPDDQRPAAIQTWLRKTNIELNERNLRQMEQSSHDLLEKAALILTPQQLEQLAAMETNKLDGQRRWLDDFRKQ